MVGERIEGIVALGKTVFTTREHIIALEARGKGLLGITLRYPYEVRKEKDYFADIADEKLPKEMLDLAKHIVGTKRGAFQPQKFEDHYEDALRELLKKKQNGEKIEAPKESGPSNVINLMDALRRSLKNERNGPTPVASRRGAAKKKRKEDGRPNRNAPTDRRQEASAPSYQKGHAIGQEAPEGRVNTCGGFSRIARCLRKKRDIPREPSIHQSSRPSA